MFYDPLASPLSLELEAWQEKAFKLGIAEGIWLTKTEVLSRGDLELRRFSKHDVYLTPDERERIEHD